MITDGLNVLTDQRRQLLAEQREAFAQRAVWEMARAQVTALEDRRHRVAANVADFRYEQKRMTLDALGMTVWRFPIDHYPRFEITASIPPQPEIVVTAL